MGKIKLFNDPIYGLIDLKHDVLYDIIDEPYFQRLRRIKQMGLSDMVYPGATHARFQHAIGATYLMQQALDTLENKNVEITDLEKLATSIAILCHDIGHGPFSHALEKIIVPFSHEDITLMFLESMKKKYGDVVALAIEIFTGRYEKKFLHQLVSSQLDVDRMDYLSRDSFYSGVAEGVIGYDRIIKMMNVYNGNIVIEEKGIYSIEKFLTSRYLMYMQVYLHKTSLAAEKMMEALVLRNKILWKENKILNLPENLEALFKINELEFDKEEFIYNFSSIDDTDIWHHIKTNLNSSDKIVQLISKSLVDRKLFKVNLHRSFDESESIAAEIKKLFTEDDIPYLFFSGSYEVEKYSRKSPEILILTKENEVKKFSEISSQNNDDCQNQTSKLRYSIYPKLS